MPSTERLLKSKDRITLSNGAIYTIDKHLGTGDSGQVYKMVGSDMALKVLYRTPVEEVTKRQESRKAAQLKLRQLKAISKERKLNESELAERQEAQYHIDLGNDYQDMQQEVHNIKTVHGQYGELHRVTIQGNEYYAISMPYIKAVPMDKVIPYEQKKYVDPDIALSAAASMLNYVIKALEKNVFLIDITEKNWTINKNGEFILIDMGNPHCTKPEEEQARIANQQILLAIVNLVYRAQIYSENSEPIKKLKENIDNILYPVIDSDNPMPTYNATVKERKIQQYKVLLKAINTMHDSSKLRERVLTDDPIFKATDTLAIRWRAWRETVFSSKRFSDCFREKRLEAYDEKIQEREEKCKSHVSSSQMNSVLFSSMGELLDDLEKAQEAQEVQRMQAVQTIQKVQEGQTEGIIRDAQSEIRGERPSLSTINNNRINNTMSKAGNTNHSIEKKESPPSTRDYSNIITNVANTMYELTGVSPVDESLISAIMYALCKFDNKDTQSSEKNMVKWDWTKTSKITSFWKGKFTAPKDLRENGITLALVLNETSKVLTNNSEVKNREVTTPSPTSTSYKS